MAKRKLELSTLGVRAGTVRSQFQEHSEALFLTSSFVFENAEQAIGIAFDAMRQPLPMISVDCRRKRLDLEIIFDIDRHRVRSAGACLGPPDFSAGPSGRGFTAPWLTIDPVPGSAYRRHVRSLWK